MTVRNVDSNLVQIIRDLQEEVKQLKANQGSVRLNSIRLGNWVLETVDDSLVQMTNLTTGEVSYIGGVGGGEGTIINQTVTFEFPPFTIGGVIRNTFNSSIRTNTYVVPYDTTITSIITTIAILGSTGVGPTFEIWHNGVLAFTSVALSQLREDFAFSRSFTAGDEVYIEFPDTGDGEHVGISIYLRA